MMTRQNRVTWFSMAVLGIFLSFALVFLYKKTQSYDPSTYFENIALLRQIKQLDARRELDAMKSKVGINKSYDPLVDPLVDLNILQRQLDQISSQHGHRVNSGLETEIKEFENALQKKSAFIEQFKSHNAILRNSLTFLPTAAEDIHALIASGNTPASGNAEKLTTSVERVLLASLVYDQAASDEKAAEIEIEVSKLIALKKNLSSNIVDSVNIFIAHVQTVLREQGLVYELLKNIAAEPTAARIDTINNSLNIEQRLNSELTQQYRHYLILFAAALIGLFLYAAIRLIRSHTVIHRINTELQYANDNLEHRVQQRTDELSQVQAELLTTARQAGMAEIATNVLHNVGNVLNSVNVSAELISNRVRTSKVPGLEKVVQLINEHGDELDDFFTNNPKGKLLPDYLGKLSVTLQGEQRAILEELTQLAKSIDHIRDIVTTQQSYAGVSSVFEEFQICELVEDALRISAGSLSRHKISVVKEFGNVSPMFLDRHQVLQILINLISNAKHAMDSTIEQEHKIILRVNLTQEQTMQVQVIDNGEGIPPENISRIFVHGFTTRKDGHGFGLHSCVLAAQGMGGRLTAFSEGVGQGAVFTLELPLTLKAKEVL